MTDNSLTETDLIPWLLDGDVSIQYQAYRDLLDEERPDLRERIATEGWAARFLAARNDNGHWGRSFYQPKWTSSHYTLLDLKNLGVSPQQPECRQTVALILDNHIAADGGIDPSVTIAKGELCVSGMFLNYASYFGAPQERLQSIVDFILAHQMADGGFNCRINRSGAVHSSLHTTISVLEGIREYERNGYAYRLPELKQAAAESQQFILLHRLFRSDHSGDVIDKRFLLLSYPCRWTYDILRALDYFQDAGVPSDPRMADALDVLRGKQRTDGRWPVQNKHPGQTHFDMESGRQPSRWNTLRALRVLQHFETGR